MQKIYLDLTPKKEKPTVYVSQYDNDRRFYIQLMEDGTEVQAAPSIDYSIVIRKPDNNIVTLAYPNVQPMIDGTIRVSLTEQACACYGISFGELILEENERREGTCNFILNVEISPEFGGIPSASEIANLKTQIDAIINQDAGTIVEEVAGPIVAELVPEVIGDNYYTKTEVQTNYYDKNTVDNKIANAKPKAIIQTLEAGETVISFTTALSATAIVEFKINEPGINEPAITETTSGENRIFTLTFDTAFDHDISIMLLNVLYEV